MKRAKATISLFVATGLVTQIPIHAGEYLTVCLHSEKGCSQVELRVTPDGKPEIFVGDEIPATGLMTFRQWYDCEAKSGKHECTQRTDRQD